MPRPPYALALLLVTGCAATAAVPRFPPDVGAAIAAHDMRRLETETLVVYYPAHRKALALRAASRMAACQQLATRRAQLASWPSREKPVVVMPELPFNNAFVMPRVTGYEEIAVVPTENTLDFATSFGLPPDPAWIGCHEVIHYVQEQQFTGLWGALNRIFGHVLSPQNGLDPWFWEGLATYYEDATAGGAGRLNWPVWRGLFEAAYAGGGVDGADLSAFKRAAPPGHHYLVGSHFIGWLVRQYGEDRLWRVIARQGRSVPLILGVSGRFKHEYGKSLSDLIDEFDAHLRANVPRRAPPPAQARLRSAGRDARYARAPDGTEALVLEGDDTTPTLEVRDPRGRVVFRERLVDLIVPRQLVIAAPVLVSGLSFTSDGRTLYLTAVDLGTTYQTTRLLRLDVARGDLDEIATGAGPGLSVSPDGARYWVADVDGDAWGIAELTLATGARRRVVAPRPGVFALRAAPSPDGRRLAVSRWNGERFEIAIVSAETGADERVIAGPIGEPVYDATFVDDHRLLYLATAGGRFQAHLHDLATDTRTPVTDAPYVAFEPRAAAGTIRFLDRDGWSWWLSETGAPEPVPVPVPLPVPDRSPPSTTSPPSASVTILSDTPYSLLDNLFTPQLHTLALAAPVAEAALFGVGLAGGDRLGLQRWALTGYAQPSPTPIRFSGAAGYQNAMLAPWTFLLEGSHFRWHHPLDLDPDEPGYEEVADRRTFDAVAAFGRTLRGTTALALQAIYTSDRYADVTDRPTFLRLGGAGLAVSHDNADATVYGGVRRRLALSANATAFPERLSRLTTDLADTRAAAIVTVPVPWTRRHNLTLDARHRALVLGDELPGFGPLVVGGVGLFAPIYGRRVPDDVPTPLVDDSLLPERLRFHEPLRGFEDWEMPSLGVDAVDLTWGYPIPIDRGSASSLYYLPAVMLRELDLELFATAASRIPPDGAGPRTHHLAYGGAITVAIAIWRLPLLVQYQIARRLTDDEAITHQVGIGAGL